MKSNHLIETRAKYLILASSEGRWSNCYDAAERVLSAYPESYELLLCNEPLPKKLSRMALSSELTKNWILPGLPPPQMKQPHLIWTTTPNLPLPEYAWR